MAESDCGFWPTLMSKRNAEAGALKIDQLTLRTPTYPLFVFHFLPEPHKKLQILPFIFASIRKAILGCSDRDSSSRLKYSV